MKFIRKTFSGFVVMLVFIAGGTHANTITSEQVMRQQSVSFNKQELLNAVSKDDVKQQLVKLGVSHADAMARIDALTDDEIIALNTEIKEGEAGGVVGAVLTVLAIIAILDLVGVTDVYPFIRPINS
ncbi:PA2779 family protein [Alteromonas gilva]|uniref:PA2779 family protein n=1 Tax=Alteromonas gilva TaxID=2987522 RepID=A0ABT5L194_9ALTE|nr:PA2779 family protein [Alteromonas gilva]MDC8830800.1 PA2779 family protein [Alteromonas gilva]